MRVVRTLATTVVAALVAVVAGCGSKPPQAGIDAPPSPPDMTLCAMLTPQDFRDAGAGSVVSGEVDGGGTAQSVTCTYGAGVEMVAQVLPTADNASAIYQALVDSGWFAADRKPSPVGGVDESLYGTGPDGAAVVLRRQKVIVLVTMPGTERESMLVQLADKALSRAPAA